MIDDFTGIAVWIFIIFLILNSVMLFVTTDPFYTTHIGGIEGMTEEEGFVIGDEPVINFFWISIECESVSATDLAFAPCFLARAIKIFDEFIKGIWNFLTGWTNILDLMIPDWVPGSQLFKNIAIPIFSIIHFFAIFVIILRVAGIVRGGS